MVYSTVATIVTPQIMTNNSSFDSPNFYSYQFNQETEILNEPTLEPTMEPLSSDDTNNEDTIQETTIQKTKYDIYPNFMFHTACDDHEQLCINSKCCPMQSQEFGCCPYQNGVCCPHLNRCCPQGYQCLSKSTANMLENIFGSRFATNFHCYVDLSIGNFFQSVFDTSDASAQSETYTQHA